MIAHIESYPAHDFAQLYRLDGWWVSERLGRVVDRERAKKKLRKLLTDPRRFVADSPIGQAATRMMMSLENEVVLSSHTQNPSVLWPRDTPLTVEDIKEAIAKRASVFFIHNDSTPHPIACSLSREWLQLIEAVLSACEENSLSPALWVGSEFQPVQFARDALVELSKDSIWLLRLSDQRSSREFYLELESWKENGDHVLGPRANAVSRRVWSRCLAEKNLPRKGEVGHLSEILAHPIQEQVTFDVDVVYTWVNSLDPDWQEQYAKHCPNKITDASSLSRFHNRDELMYSLRALSLQAPWVRKVHIVSNCAPPSWLDIDHPRLNWVDHKEIIDEKILPTFSSHAIESRLHHIQGLSNHFIYFNDDCLLVRPVRKPDFFTASGHCKAKLEGWGSVNGEPCAAEPDYLNASRNCQKLIERDFQHSPTRLHTHSPQALRIDVLHEMEQRYQKEFEQTGRAKFRGMTDINVTSFFFHHYALATGRAIEDTTPTMLIQHGHNFVEKYNKLIKERTSPLINKRYLSACVNDGAGSHENPKWNTATGEFMSQYFPEKSEFER